VIPSGAFASLRDGAPAGEVELDAWVTDIYTCPPCPPKAMCKPCDAPNFTVSTQKTTPGGESFRLYTKAGPPKDLAVGLRYHFKIAVRPGANMYERLEILGAKRLP
jgi:hypothetical protein